MTILLGGIVGSTAYGLAGPHSDIDRLGVFAAPTEEFHGLRPPIGRSATVTRSNPDVTVHEARKFASLALAANPTVSELLWLPDIRDRQAKHGRHLLRLLDQGLALYATGRLPIRPADPARYLEFGQRVADDPEAARPVLAAARATFDSVRSPLPGHPDEATVQRWLLRVRRAQLCDPATAGPPGRAPVPG